MYKKGFTLAEVLIVLGILSIIAAMTMSILFKVLPNKDEENWQKTAYTIQNIIAQMHNDESMYPKLKDFYKQGFKNTDKISIKGSSYGGNELDGTNEDENRKTKFCRLLASRFEKHEQDNSIVCLEPGSGSSSVITGDEPFYSTNKSFTTTDNMDWFLFKDDFTEGYSVVIVDVNGSDCPNTTSLEKPANGCNGRYKMPDRRKFYIRSNGTFTDIAPGRESEITPYAISVSVVCNDKTDDCGHVTINKDGIESDSDSAFVNLQLGETYTLKAIPKKETSGVDAGTDAYTSNWGINNEKQITVNGQVQNIKTTVRFSQVEKKDIELNIEGCMESKILDECISSSGFTLKKYTKWNSTNNNDLIKGQGNVDGTIIKTYSSRFSENEENDKLTTTEVPVGNYRLQFSVKWPYAVYSTDQHKITTTFKKDFRIGPKDIEYTINLLKCEEISVQKEDGGNSVALRVCEYGGNGYDSSDNEYVYDIGTKSYQFGDDMYKVPD